MQNFDEEKSPNRKKIYLGIFGLVIAVAVVLGTMGYFLGHPEAVVPQPKLPTPRMSQPEQPAQSVSKLRRAQPATGLKFLILKKEGNGSVLYSSISGLERKVYRDTDEIFNPTNIIGGFAFCKKGEDGENAVYTKLFSSFNPPKLLNGVSPLNCLFTIDIKRDMNQVEQQKIYYVGEDPISRSKVVYSLKMDAENLSKPLNIFSRIVDIDSRPFKINSDSEEYVYVENEEFTTNHKLVKHNISKFEYLYEADHPFDFITTKQGAVTAVLDPDSDNIKIFRDFKAENSRTFTTTNDTIKKIIFSSSGDSIYCLICSKNQADICKVIEVSLKGDEPKRTRDLIINIEPDADIILMR